jgi:AcrR family transcriptional regulator
MSGQLQDLMDKQPSPPQNARRYRGQGGEERRAERRARLLDAGLRVFGEVGFHSATVKTICAVAGLTERYFYESFSNSEDLLCAVYEEHMVLQQQRIAEAVLQASREPLAMMEAGLRAFLELARENPAGARVQLLEVLGVSPRVDRLYRQSIENFARLMRSWNAQLFPDEALTVEDEEMLSVGLVGAAVGVAGRWMLAGFAQPLDAMLQTLMVIFRGVMLQRGQA